MDTGLCCQRETTTRGAMSHCTALSPFPYARLAVRPCGYTKCQQVEAGQHARKDGGSYIGLALIVGRRARTQRRHFAKAPSSEWFPG
jgi:hypothetical protein